MFIFVNANARKGGRNPAFPCRSPVSGLERRRPIYLGLPLERLGIALQQALDDAQHMLGRQAVRNNGE